MSRLLLSVAVSVLLLPVLVIAAASGGNAVASPTETAATTIPGPYLSLYMQAGIASGLPWQLLAAVGKVECDHGQSPAPSCTQEGVENTAGAGGPMQFLAATWSQYGIDADSDGRADRWDPADAIFSTANYLKASGAPGNDPAALYAYNHSQAYVQEVLAWAGVYAESDPGSGSSSTRSPNDASAAGASAAAQTAVAYALTQLGTPYRWGGDGPGGFDCSGLVQAAYAAAGIQLPRVAQAQFDAGHLLPAGQPADSWPAYRDLLASLFNDNPILPWLEHPALPTVVVVADQDDTTPASDILSRGYEGVRVVELEGDHRLPIAAPEALLSAIADTHS